VCGFDYDFKKNTITIVVGFSFPYKTITMKSQKNMFPPPPTPPPTF
jgi:hypothetical protein